MANLEPTDIPEEVQELEILKPVSFCNLLLTISRIPKGTLEILIG